MSAKVPPFPPQEARRLIDHGLKLWDRRPGARGVVWRDGPRWYRVRATSFRFLLDWRAAGDRDWRPGFFRWS